MMIKGEIVSWLGNLYIRENRFCSLTINRIIGSDFCILELNMKETPDFKLSNRFPEGIVKIVITNDMAFALAKLLSDKSITNEKGDSSQMKDFYNGRRDNFEYISI